MKHLTGAKFETVLNVCLITGRTFSPKNFGTTIAFISKQRVTDMFHMSSDLVGTTCFQNTFHQSCIAIPFHHLVVSNGGFAYLRIRRKNFHPQTVFRVTSDISFYPSFILYYISPHQSIITPMSSLIKELLTKRCLGIRRFRNDK